MNNRNDVAAVRDLLTPKEEEPVAEVPVEEPEVEEPVEVEGEEAEPVAEPETEDEGPRTIAELAEAIEVDAAYLYELEVGMGEGRDPVKLGQLKDEYQAVIREREELKQKAEEAQKYAEQAYNFQSGLQGVSQEMIQALSEADAIQKQYEAQDWATLEKSDAGRAALLKQKYMEAYQAAQGKVQQAEAKEREAQQQQLQMAGARMLDLIPEWKDQGVRKAEQDRIRKMLHGEGLEDSYINQIADPIAMKLLRELEMLRAEKGIASQAIQKGRKKPKVLKGGGRTPAPDKSKQAQELVKKARNSSPSTRRKDELAAAKALLGVR